MSALSTGAHLIHHPSLSNHHHRRRRRNHRLTTHFSSITSTSSAVNSSLSSHRDRNNHRRTLLPLALSSHLPSCLSTSFAVLSSGILLFLTLNFPGGGGIGGKNSGGGGGGGGGNWWWRFLTPAAHAEDDENIAGKGWDNHGLPANIVVQLNKLSGFKKYKLSEILFLDLRRRSTVGSEDSFFEMVSLRPGGVYTKAQLQKELENLATCGMFEKVDLEGKTNADGTIGVTISFTESTWQSAERFRYDEAVFASIVDLILVSYPFERLCIEDSQKRK